MIYRRRGKLRVGKVSRIALYFVYRRKSFAMLILHTNLLLYKYKHVETSRRKSFAIATAIVKFAKLFPRVTFPAYGMPVLKANESRSEVCATCHIATHCFTVFGPVHQMLKGNSFQLVRQEGVTQALTIGRSATAVKL